LKRYTPSDHPDYPLLEEAFQKMSETADYINEKKQQDETRQRLVEISKKLVGNLSVRKFHFFFS
jgi:hypothetical protein